MDVSRASASSEVFLPQTDKQNVDDDLDKSFKEMVEEAEKKKKKTKKIVTKSKTDDIMAYQREQFDYQKEQDAKFENMLRETFEEQRKTDMEERQKDRDFFLELGKIFSGNN